jgi:integrase
MASIYRDKSRGGYRLTVSVRGHRRALWLGELRNKRGLELIARHVQELANAAELNCPPSLDAAAWSQNVGPRIAAKLAEWGLISSSPARSALPGQLGPWIDFYIASRTDTKERTRNRYRNAKSRIIAHIPATTPLSSITPGDGDRLARELRKSSKPTTAGKIIKQARMFLEAAKKDRLITENPFSGLSAAGKIDQTRKHYIEPATAAALIAKAPDCTWRLIIALSRYAGFRAPSEIIALEWDHIDWESSLINNHSPKTGLRKVPIFAEVRPYLDQCWEIADGQRYVVPKYRHANSGPLTKRLKSICKLAGVKCWAKPWVNLRASARTDLEARFPSHVCNVWLGHGSAVAEEHYLRVTPDHLAAACGAPSGARQVIRDDSHRQSAS